MAGPTMEGGNILNYRVGKGIVSIKLSTDADYVDVGDVPEFEFTPTIERLDHFSSRAGIARKDRSVVRTQSGTLRMVMHEWTPRNLGLALLGLPNTADPSQVSIDIMSQESITAAVKFVGTNDVGPKWTTEFPFVEFAPSTALGLISEEWSEIEVEGEVLFDEANGRFGVATADFSLT